MIRAAHALSHRGRRALMLAASAAFVLLLSSESPAQSDFRTQLFREATETLARAKALNADLLAPRNYRRGTDAYSRADNLFNRHKPLDEIKEQIHAAAQYFTLASDESRTAQTEFATVLKARADAVSSDAVRLSQALWDRAEELLLTAAAALEDGDVRSARTGAGESQGIYRSAELEAIELNLLTPARELLARAQELKVDVTARETLERAYQRLNLAEAMVRQNRYDITEARRLAGDAKYEAAHAIYLHEIITQMEDHKLTFEDAILLSEAAIGHIASALNMPVRFDGGYAPVVQQIIAAVRSRDTVRAMMAENIKRLHAENDALQRRLTSIELSGGTSPGGPREGERQREDRQRYNSAVALAGTFFAPNEGVVLREGDTVILRVTGLIFSRRDNALEPGSSGILSKIDHAARLFPGSRVMVEGHTETGESETLNQKNSEACAAAVAAYLKLFPPASQSIDFSGWGSSCPIADNMTAEGRARNRRIDIVIVPEWALTRP
jgi:OmpA-OmpF porin, OOP family